MHYTCISIERAESVDDEWLSFMPAIGTGRDSKAVRDPISSRFRRQPLRRDWRFSEMRVGRMTKFSARQPIHRLQESIVGWFQICTFGGFDCGGSGLFMIYFSNIAAFGSSAVRI
jgi:hypothetical protein